MEPQKSALTVPLAIVIAGVLIAGAVVVSREGETNQISGEKTASGREAVRALFPDDRAAAQTERELRVVSMEIRNIDANRDHILGNPNAEIMIVEYSDTECPFCKRFHATMQQVMGSYGKSGRVAWTYRYFPLASLHPKAPHEAEALECAATLGGNSGFWKYADRIFEVTPSNNGLDTTELPAIAAFAGLNRSAFETCLSGGAARAAIEADYNEVTGAGGTGTPFNIFVLKKPLTSTTKKYVVSFFEPYRDPRTGELPIAVSSDNLKLSLSGAMPFEVMKTVIEKLLTN